MNDLAINPLERLAALVAANDRLMVDLAASASALESARRYLDKVDANPRFGAAHLERCRGRHSSLLAQLRRNRIDGLQILGNS